MENNDHHISEYFILFNLQMAAKVNLQANIYNLDMFNS